VEKGFWRADHHSEEQKERQKRASSYKSAPQSFCETEEEGIFIGSRGEKYLVTMDECECFDFLRRGHACKHMYRLAYELGHFCLYDVGGVEHSPPYSIDEIIEMLSEAEARTLKYHLHQVVIQKRCPIRAAKNSLPKCVEMGMLIDMQNQRLKVNTDYKINPRFSPIFGSLLRRLTLLYPNEPEDIYDPRETLPVTTPIPSTPPSQPMINYGFCSNNNVNVTISISGGFDVDVEVEGLAGYSSSDIYELESFFEVRGGDIEKIFDWLEESGVEFTNESIKKHKNHIRHVMFDNESAPKAISSVATSPPSYTPYAPSKKGVQNIKWWQWLLIVFIGIPILLSALDRVLG